MQAISSFPFKFSSLVLASSLALLALFSTTGCSTGSPQPQTGFAGTTQVTVLLSSTANDQVTRFATQLQSLTLTSRLGKTVTLLSSQQPAEFTHLNGGLEPLTTVTVPQEIYTSASITVGGAVFVCIGQVPGGGLGIANYSIINQAAALTLSSPITVTGSSMALLLNMQVSSSAILPSNCWTTPAFEGFSMTPTFNLTPVTLSTSPTNSGNGKVSGLNAEVASITGSSLTLTIAGGPYGTRTVSANSNNQTVFQGINGASDLSPGMFLNVDGAIQSDGSLLAARIEAEDSTALNDSSGPVMFVDSALPVLELYGRTELGPLQNISGRSGIYFDIPNFDFSSATFQISGQFTNLQNLPFVPSFNAANIVTGQNVDITSGNFVLGGPSGTPANTITLVPQTIDGTLVGSQPSGSFNDYTVSLASYDLFPTLAVQPGQTTLLNNPSEIEVYVDNNTQMLNAQTLALGSTFRFYGLVFNDNGTLRMDCARVGDGVSVTPQSTSSVRVPARVQVVSRKNARPLRIATTATGGPAR